jgi:ferrous iron transport protein A
MFSKFTVCFSSLALMKPNERGVIGNYIERDESIIRQLIDLGILPGLPITLKKKSPLFTIAIGDRQLEIEQDLARSISVRVT